MLLGLRQREISDSRKISIIDSSDESVEDKRDSVGLLVCSDPDDDPEVSRERTTSTNDIRSTQPDWSTLTEVMAKRRFATG
ncbi:unnamed protein product [Haemonchus placei]|uniref:Uncharacterized protein n=1 Tax=Haemonchus placei TaxID=6290 RepID=A0A0N4X0G7_HAEPC|nr:unnamed protein product [Haemonchus placei]